MVFTKEDKLVIKFLRESKCSGAKRYLPEFPANCKAVLRFIKPELKTLTSWASVSKQRGKNGPANYRYCSQAVAHSPSCMCQGKRRPLWAQAALTKRWNARQKFSVVAFSNWFLLWFPNFWSNVSLAIMHTTYVTELNSSCTVLVSTVTRVFDIFVACDAPHLDIPLAEISYNSAVYNESYTQKT